VFPLTGGGGDTISIAYAVTWPQNQWAQAQIDALNSPDYAGNNYSSVLLVMGRGAGQDNGYAFEIDGPLGPACNVQIFSLNNDIPTYYLSDGSGGDVTIPLYAGDSIRMELFDGMISVYTIHGGVKTQILAPTVMAPVTLGAAPLNNGPVALDLFPITVPADVQISNFSGGSITNPPPTPPTKGTIVGPYYGATLAQAFTNPQGLDILQVADQDGNCIWKLTNTGATVMNPTSYTSEALLARYQGNTIAEAFTNPYNLNLLQILSQGGAVVFYVDYTGASHSTNMAWVFTPKYTISFAGSDESPLPAPWGSAPPDDGVTNLQQLSDECTGIGTPPAGSAMYYGKFSGTDRWDLISQPCYGQVTIGKLVSDVDTESSIDVLLCSNIEVDAPTISFEISRNTTNGGYHFDCISDANGGYLVFSQDFDTAAPEAGDVVICFCDGTTVGVYLNGALMVTGTLNAAPDPYADVVWLQINCGVAIGDPAVSEFVIGTTAISL
jgi:hypothetical protein